MSAPGNVLRSTNNAVKKTWKTKLSIGTMATVATLFSSLAAAEHGNLGAAGVDLRDGIVAVGRPVVHGVGAGAEFLAGLIFGNSDPKVTVKVPHVSLPSVQVGGASGGGATPSPAPGDVGPKPYPGEGWREYLTVELGHSAADASKCYVDKDLANVTLLNEPTPDPC